MPLMLVIVFFTVFAVMMISIGVGARVLEIQRRKRVNAMVAVAEDAVHLPSAAILVQQASQGASAIEKVLARLDFVRAARAKLEQSGLDWPFSKLLFLMAVSAAAGALVALKLRILINPVLSSLALGTVLSAIPWLYVLSKRRKRLRAFEEQFPEGLDFLARAIRAGHAFSASLQMLSQESPEPMGSEFKRVYNEQNLGGALAVALRHLTERVPLVDVRFFVSAVLMQRETGGNLGEILTRLAQIIRERFRLKGQVRAISAHGRITAAVLTFLPIVVVVGLMATNPQYLQTLVRESEGKYLIIGSVAGQLMGYLIMRKIVNIKV